MNTRFLAILGAGLVLVAAANSASANGSASAGILPADFQPCPVGQSAGACMNGTVHPEFRAQIQALVAGETGRLAFLGRDPQARGGATAPLSHSQDSATGPSDRVAIDLLGAIPVAVGVGGLLGIDHRLSYDNAGVWKRTNQLDLEYAVIAAEFGGALWYGGENRIGRTFWQSLDASTFSALAAQGLKYVFSRARPDQSVSPNHWFQGGCCQSFPSGEVTLQASFITPFILEYHRRDPWVWGLEALPLYDALGRMKTWGHWQTDVLSGWMLGTAFGIVAHNRAMPFFLSYMPHGIMVGWAKSF